MKSDHPLSTRHMIMLLVLTFLVSVFTLTISYWPLSLKNYQINTPAPRHIISWYTFDYENQQARVSLREEIEKTIPLYYRPLPGAKEENWRLVKEWVSFATNQRREVFENYLIQKNYLYNESMRDYILHNRFLLARYENRLFSALEFLHNNYLLTKKVSSEFSNIVYLHTEKEIKSIPLRYVLFLPVEKTRLQEIFQILYGDKTSLLYEAMAEILLYLLVPTAELDETTRENIILTLIEKNIPREVIHKGETIVSKGNIISLTNMQHLQAYHHHQEKILRFRFPVILLLMLIIFVLFLYYYRKYEEIFWKKSSLFIIALIFYILNHLFLLYAHLSTGTFSLPPFLNIPFPILILALPILFNQHTVSFILLINFSIYALFYPLTDTITFANLLSLALFALYTASRKRKTFQKRYDFFLIGLEIATIQAVFSLFYTWYYHIHLLPSDWLFLAIFCIGNGLISALVAFGILPILEYVFNIPTYFRLTELASPFTSPLLNELKEKASRTYQHSLQLGEMCERAASAIGADALLARVGAYYHDVGKLYKPEFFIENQSENNPHDDIKPTLSVSIIKSHVKHGIELARQYHLPEEIIRFIEEHHGTTSISYFYLQALQLYGEETINPADYQYPGPKPQSIETAILMLADGIEATTRALLQKQNEEIRFTLLEDIVDDIIEQRLQSGQLEECPITLRQIKIVRDVFIEYLSAHYHRRIEYVNRR